jgi:outer membrane biosynthesis protein TonB
MDLGAHAGRRKEGGDGGTRSAVAGSLALHALIVAGLLLAEGALGHAPPPAPRMKVYAVNIVSPPPTLHGAPPIEAPAPNVGGSTPPAPQPAPAPPPAPAPAPAPRPPTPEPPRPTPVPPKEPVRAPEPRTPEPRTPPRPQPAPTSPTRPTPPKPAATPPTRPPAPATGPGAGANSAGTGTRGQPTGRNPDPSSAGGEGLNVSQRGAECPSPGYCENIVRQVRRYFRRPDGSNGTAEACFTIRRDGSVDDIEVRRVRGGFTFRMAVQEAVEQAGLRKAFGGLPQAFSATELPVCVDISPEL